MDHTRPIADRLAPAPVSDAGAARRAALSLVSSRLSLAQPAEPAPAEWHNGLANVLQWLGIDAAFVPAARPRRLARLADWAQAAEGTAPVFAPWLGWSPVAFQHGGLPALPAAQFVASYLLEHPRGAAPGQGGIDLVLMSPHPALCAAEAAGEPVLPRAGVLRNMIRMAREEGRERVAIILHARQRNAVAAQLLAAGKGLTRAGLTLDILTIEDALAPLMSRNHCWDAIIAMPDLRGPVFTLLGHASGVRRAWPMLWFAGDGAGAGRGRRTLRLVMSEAPGEGMSHLPLDAAALILALALTLQDAGARRAAVRLHDAWARLRDSGVTTPGRGCADSPYMREVQDSGFLAMLCDDAAVSKRPQKSWRALEIIAHSAIDGSHSPQLRVVAKDQSHNPLVKGR